MSWNRSNSTNKNRVIYSLININDTTKDKECIAADKKNEKKYRETIEKTRNSTKLWENTGVTINLDVPTPPKPNNYERLLDFRKKNVLRPAIKQSEATIYLYERNYVLGRDYEAYQALDIVEKLKKYDLNEGDDDNYVENCDSNIFDDRKNSVISNNFFNRRNSVMVEDNSEIKDNMDLNIFEISPKTERKRRSMSFYHNDNIARSISLPGNNLDENNIYNYDNENIYRNRSNSEMNHRINHNNYMVKERIEKKIDQRVDSKVNTKVNRRINDFQNLGNINRTEKEDLLPKKQLYPDIDKQNINNYGTNNPQPTAPPAPRSQFSPEFDC